MTNLVDHLSSRGFIHQTSDPSISKVLTEERVSCYAGFDPSDSSLHLGNLIPILGLMHFQKAGHRPIAVVGGATGMVGDPSGKDLERQLLSIDTIRTNEMGIRKQLERFLDFDNSDTSAIVVNNYDWLGKFHYLDFLRDVGKHFSVNAMIAKESVKKRLETRDQGISYTEFSYQILQAYDFYHLWKTYGCKVQIGGSDQWGNITAGIDLCRRLGGDQLYGITFPLLMSSTGKKYGKSEGNALWLDENRTQPFEFYQYFLQVDDRDVIRDLLFFTSIPEDHIRELEKCVQTQPEKREAQRVLATEMTRIVHGNPGVESAERATRVLFGDEPIEGFNDRILGKIFADIPSTIISRKLLHDGLQLADIMVKTQMTKTKSEARRLIAGGGVYCNNKRITDVNRVMTLDDLASETIMILRSGKKHYTLARFIDRSDETTP